MLLHLKKLKRTTIFLIITNSKININLKGLKLDCRRKIAILIPLANKEVQLNLSIFQLTMVNHLKNL
jgi:hypothetical protein